LILQKYRSMENRYKTQIDELTRCCEKIKAEKETVEKRLKEVSIFAEKQVVCFQSFIRS